MCTAVRAAVPLYPRGPRFGPGCVVPVHHHLIGPIRPTRRHTATGAFPICSEEGWTKGPDFDSLRVPRRHPWALTHGISRVTGSAAKNWI